MLQSDLLTLVFTLILFAAPLQASASSPSAGVRRHRYSTGSDDLPGLETLDLSPLPEAGSIPGNPNPRWKQLRSIYAAEMGLSVHLSQGSELLHDRMASGSNPPAQTHPLGNPERALDYDHIEGGSSGKQARLSRYIKRARTADLEGYRNHGKAVDAAGGGSSSQALDKGTVQEPDGTSTSDANSVSCCSTDSAVNSCNGAGPQLGAVRCDAPDNLTGALAYSKAQLFLLSNISSPDPQPRADNPNALQDVLGFVRHSIQLLSEPAPQFLQSKSGLAVHVALAVIAGAILLAWALRRQRRRLARKAQQVKGSCSPRSLSCKEKHVESTSAAADSASTLKAPVVDADALHAATDEPAAGCNSAQQALPSSGSSFTGEDSAAALSSDSDSSSSSLRGDVVDAGGSNTEDNGCKAFHTTATPDNEEPCAHVPVVEPSTSATTPPAAACFDPEISSTMYSLGRSDGEPGSSKEARNSLKAARRGFVPSPRPRKRLTPSRSGSPLGSKTVRSAAATECVDEDGEELEEAGGEACWFPRGAVLSSLGDVGSPIAITPARAASAKSSAAAYFKPSGMAARSSPATPAPPGGGSPRVSAAAAGEAPDTGGSMGAESPSLEILESLLTGYAARMAKSNERNVLAEAVNVVRQRRSYRRRRRQQRQQGEYALPEAQEDAGPSTSAAFSAGCVSRVETAPAGIRRQPTKDVVGGGESAGMVLAGAGGSQPWRDVGATTSHSSWSLVAVGDGGSCGGYLPQQQQPIELPQLMYPQPQDSRGDPCQHPQQQDQQLQLLSASFADLMAAPAPPEGLNPAWAVAVATAQASRQMAEMTTVMRQMAGQMVDLGSGMRELNGGVREGSGLLRTLVVSKEIEVQRALAAAAMQRGVWVMWLALAVGSYKWGRLTTVLSRCSMDPASASSSASAAASSVSSRSPLSYAGWIALRSVSWVASLGTSTSAGGVGPGGVSGGGTIGFLGRLIHGGLMGPPWLRQAWCYTSELGLLSFGGLLLVYCIYPLLRRTATLDLSRSWQLDIPLVMGCLWGLLGAQVVHCLGGKWTVWLLGWWAWCLAGGLMHGWRLRSGWMQAAAGLLVGLLWPAALGGIAYAGWGLPAHLVIEDWWWRLWSGELGTLSWSGWGVVMASWGAGGGV